MTQPYTTFENLAGLAEAIQPDSIISRTFYRDERLKAILFGFDAGQELSEHTASQPAVIQIVSGRAAVTLGDDAFEADAGFWAHMPPHLKHSITARTPVVMLLLMLGG